MQLMAWEMFKKPNSWEEDAASLWSSQMQNLKQGLKK